MSKLKKYLKYKNINKMEEEYYFDYVPSELMLIISNKMKLIDIDNLMTVKPYYKEVLEKIF
jgi:hypothetical protein